MQHKKWLVAMAGAWALLVCVLALPKMTQARTRTGSDLGTRIATLENDIGAVNTLLENVMRVGDDLFVNSGLNASGPGALGPNGAHIACFENTNGGTADGVAIQIDRAPCYSENNFTTFYNDDEYVCGRIEGFALLEGDPATNFPSVPSIGIDDFIQINLNFITFSGGRLPSLDPGALPSFGCDGLDCGFSGGRAPSLDIGALPSVSFSSPITITNPLDATGDIVGWLADVICWAFENDMQSLIQTDPFGLALAPLILAEATLCKNGTTGEGGVTYGSTGADYAEWLEKLDPDERFQPGEVVGVHGGKISKRTAGAHQVMAISRAPAVVGNLPQPLDQPRFEKVGFMGQVPVLVRGHVDVGDYIVPSGLEDGTAIALAPEDLDIENLAAIVGRAWSASDAIGVATVNVAVGVKTRAGVSICARQADEIEALREAIEALKARGTTAAPPPDPEDGHQARSGPVAAEGGAR